MLKKMFIHGLIAAAVIGTTAAVYAAGRGDGYALENTVSAKQGDIGGRDAPGNGYIADGGQGTERDSFFGFLGTRGHDRDDDHGERSEHRRERHDHDDD